MTNISNISHISENFKFSSGVEQNLLILTPFPPYHKFVLSYSNSFKNILKKNSLPKLNRLTFQDGPKEQHENCYFQYKTQQRKVHFSDETTAQSLGF